MRKEFQSQVSWKGALEAFAEGYHFPFVHGESVIGQNTLPNTGVYDEWGRHHRIGFPFNWIRNLADDPSYAHVRDELARALADWRERTHDDLPDEAAGTATAEAFMDAFHAKAAQVEAEEEALPSRRPLGARRELAGDLTSGER